MSRWRFTALYCALPCLCKSSTSMSDTDNEKPHCLCGTEPHPQCASQEPLVYSFMLASCTGGENSGQVKQQEISQATATQGLQLRPPALAEEGLTKHGFFCRLLPRRPARPVQLASWRPRRLPKQAPRPRPPRRSWLQRRRPRSGARWRRPQTAAWACSSPSRCTPGGSDQTPSRGAISR